MNDKKTMGKAEIGESMYKAGKVYRKAIPSFDKICDKVAKDNPSIKKILETEEGRNAFAGIMIGIKARIFTQD